MADNSSRKNSFIIQAGILAAAGIISRIIGLLYRGPLHRVIGDLDWDIISLPIITTPLSC